MLSVLVILIGQFQYSANVDARIAENYAVDRENYYAARGALNLANALLIKDAGKDQIDTLADDWADSSVLNNFSVGEVSTLIEVKDQERFLNINRLHSSGSVNDDKDPEFKEYLWVKRALGRLIDNLGLEQVQDGEESNLAERIADWIDADSKGEYEEGAPNKPLATMEEMLQIPGVTKKVMYGDTDEHGNMREGLASYITLWGKEEEKIYKININTAPPETLRAIIHIDDQEMVSNYVDNIIKYREGKYSEKETPFNAPNDLINVPELSDIFTRDKQLASHLTVKSTFFEVSIEATRAHMKMRVNAVERRNGKNIIQYFWRERQAAAGLPSLATKLT
jgi:type II secretory pathway component PulK